MTAPLGQIFDVQLMCLFTLHLQEIKVPERLEGERRGSQVAPHT